MAKRQRKLFKTVAIIAMLAVMVVSLAARGGSGK